MASSNFPFDGNKLRELRTQKGMSIEQLAAKLDVDKSAVSLWETGKTKPYLRRIKALAKLFGIRERDLAKE